MKTLRRRARRLAAIAALTPLAFASSEPAGAQLPLGASSAPVLVAPPLVDRELEPIAEAYAAWLRDRIHGVGMRTVDQQASPSPGRRGPETGRMLEAAAALGATYALFPRLRFEHGDAEVRLVLYSTDSREPAAVTRAVAPLASVGAACEDSAVQLLAHLGVRKHSIPAAPPPQLDGLASSSRALTYRHAGEIGRAWREVEGKLSPTAMRLREALAASARRPEAPAPARARVLAATGDLEVAWNLIAAQIARETREGRPDPESLLAAGEVQLARNNPREARAYLEEALRLAPGDPDVHLQLARALALQNDHAGARRAFSRAAELDPRDPRPLELLAELERDDPSRAAQHLLDAGRRAAQQLDPHRAQRLLERAAELDPAAAAASWRARGELKEMLGLREEALAAYQRALSAGGGDDAATFRGIGRLRRGMRDYTRAEAAYRKALTLGEDDPQTLRELGALYTERGRAAKAIPLLERAVEIDASDGGARRSLARALRATGRRDRALEILAPSDTAGAETPETLRLVAELNRGQQQLEAARYALLRAIESEPHDGALHEQLAWIFEAEGDSESARRELDLAARLAGDSGAQQDAAVITGASAEESLEEFVLSFARQVAHPRQRLFAQLGVRESTAWKTRLRHWLHPQAPNLEQIERSLERSLARHFQLVSPPASENPALQSRIDRLYDFDSDESLGAHSIADVNEALGTSAVFVARLDSAPPTPDDADGLDPRCAAPDRFELELRMLSGNHPDTASILTNVECLAGGIDVYGEWNRRAFAAYALLLLTLFFPLLRGWGTVVVSISVPPRTKGFFSIHVAKKPDDSSHKKKKEKGLRARLERTLRSLSRYHRHMAGRQTTFRWIPARKRAYTVIVRGPLLDAIGGEIIGHFLEEQGVRVARGETARLLFDFCPKECALEVSVLLDGQPAPGACVAIQGDASSLRYARDGKAFLYLGKGTYTVLVASTDRVAQCPVEIRSLESAIPLIVDLAEETALDFCSAPGALEPYLQGDFAASANVLEAAGDAHTSHLVRGALYRQRGELGRAAAELEAAGRVAEAAELRAQNSEFGESAALFERAGDFERAAEMYRSTGDIGAAARCYESAFDFENALECYREVENDEKLIELLEKTGVYLEAATLARERGDVDRAIHNLQQIRQTDGTYAQCCGMYAEILSERGEYDLAANKMEEALRACGGENAPVAMHERHAALLEKMRDWERALQAYETIRRRDPNREDVAKRIETLRAELDDAARIAATRDSRYEILGELGRGGMGVVLKARDRRLGRIVALKRLPENLRDHPTAVSMFLREARAAAALNHRNIVTLFDAGEENRTYFITMELLEGSPLNAILRKRKRLGPRDVARLGIQIAAGLHYAHARRIVHRDIKTANLFFTTDRVVKIMDFGIAKTMEEVRRVSTVVSGTPFYMAPEQASGEAVDHRADLYAFGVTLFELVSGSVPFREGDVAYHRLHTRAPDPRQLVEGVPGALAELILELLAKDPADRCASAAEVGKRLQAILDAAGR